MPRVKRILLQGVKWTVAASVFSTACVYLNDAYLRVTRSPACRWNSVPAPNGSPYSARYCFLHKQTVLFRLYDSNGATLLAERDSLQLDLPFISWDAGRIWYDTSPDDSFVALPPTLFDRLRAKLP